MITTPFEDGDYRTSTTLANEADYVSALLQEYPAITRTELGTSIEGRPIYSLSIGTGQKRPLMMISSIHADEQVPREAALTFIRDLADDPSPEIGALLADRALHIVPTPNPDGYPFKRQNAADIDPNRQWIALPDNAPETRILVEMLYDLDPVFLLDCHEWWMGTMNQPFFVGVAWHVSGHGVRVESETTARAIADAVGGDVPWYPGSPLGNSNQLAAALGIPTALTETVYEPQKAGDMAGRRYRDNRTSMETWLSHMATHADAYEEASDAARRDMAGRVDRTATAWSIDLNAPADGSAASGTVVTAAGYTVPEAEWPTSKALLDRHRIDYDDASRTVSLAQERAQVAVLVLDPASPFTTSPNATRLQVPAIPPPRFGHDPAMDLYENVVT